jgi:hypothetical protein
MVTCLLHLYRSLIDFRDKLGSFPTQGGCLEVKLKVYLTWRRIGEEEKCISKSNSSIYCLIGCRSKLEVLQRSLEVVLKRIYKSN